MFLSAIQSTRKIPIVVINAGYSEALQVVAALGRYIIYCLQEYSHPLAPFGDETLSL